MQWEHQIRSPGMPDGMAFSFPEEVLRAVQDAVSIHKVIPPTNATDHTDFSVH